MLHTLTASTIYNALPDDTPPLGQHLADKADTIIYNALPADTPPLGRHPVYKALPADPPLLGRYPIRVPQVLYKNPGQLSNFRPRPSIDFSSPTDTGPSVISLQEALDGDCPAEWKSDTRQLFPGTSTRIICRFNVGASICPSDLAHS